MLEFLRSWCSHVPQRFVVCALGTGAIIICYIDRQLFFLAMQRLVFHSHKNEDLTNISSCPKMIETSNQFHYAVEYYWEKSLVGAISQAFFIGYLIILFPAGMLSDYYGAQIVLVVGLLLTSVMTLWSPGLAVEGPMYLMMARFFQGVGQAMVFPSTMVMVAQWAPVTERVTFTAIISSGKFVGWFLGYMFPSMISYISNSWKLQFYLVGLIGILWALLVFGFTSTRPAESRFITDAELTMIFNNSEGIDRQNDPVRPYVPWRPLLRSLPMWSFLLNNWGSCWFHYIMLILISSYFHHVIRMTEALSDKASTFAVFSTAPSTIFWGVVSDWLVNHKYLNRHTSKKAFMVTSNIVLALLLLLLPLMGCNGPASVSLFLVMCYWRGLYFSMYRAVLLDMGPQHMGVLTSMLNSTDAMAALFSWELGASIRQQPSDVKNWWQVFICISFMLVVFSLVFLKFGSTQLQPWNYTRGRSRPSRFGSLPPRSL